MLGRTELCFLPSFLKASARDSPQKRTGGGRRWWRIRSAGRSPKAGVSLAAGWAPWLRVGLVRWRVCLLRWSERQDPRAAWVLSCVTLGQTCCAWEPGGAEGDSWDQRDPLGTVQLLLRAGHVNWRQRSPPELGHLPLAPAFNLLRPCSGKQDFPGEPFPPRVGLMDTLWSAKPRLPGIWGKCGNWLTWERSVGNIRQFLVPNVAEMMFCFVFPPPTDALFSISFTVF